MPFFAQQNREQLRQMYFDAWRKQQQHLPMTPLEAQIAAVIEQHPEYHRLFADGGALHRDWLPEGGGANPFLHLGLHLAVRDQITTDRPPGIRQSFQQLASRSPTAHDAEHRLIDCMAETLWSAQRSSLPPDENAYMVRVRTLIRRHQQSQRPHH